MKTKRPLLYVVALLLVVGPLLIWQWVSARDTHFDELVNQYECHGEKCEADFNGDGIAGYVERMMDDTAVPSNRLLVVVDNNRELLRLPYTYIDGTFRTHVAIRNDSGKARLLIFDATDNTKPRVKAVYAWDGQKMVQVPPRDIDGEILAAMAARDDAGSWNNWALYRAFSLPLLIGYYLLVIGVVIGFVLRPRLWPGSSSLKSASS
jgi:hypothetical protein